VKGGIARSGDGESREISEEGRVVSSRLFLFLILGFVLVFVGVVIIFISTVFYAGSSANVGAVIFIGPFPIVIGAGPDVTWIILFSVILAVLSIVVFLVMNRRMRRFTV
jgi:uncharacterized membrane protein